MSAASLVAILAISRMEPSPERDAMLEQMRKDMEHTRKTALFNAAIMFVVGLVMTAVFVRGIARMIGSM